MPRHKQAEATVNANQGKKSVASTLEETLLSGITMRLVSVLILLSFFYDICSGALK